MLSLSKLNIKDTDRSRDIDRLSCVCSILSLNIKPFNLKWIICTIGLFVHFHSFSQNFIDQGELLGIAFGNDSNILGAGSSFYDINNDGWDDITLSQTGGAPIILLNIDGTFVQQDWGIPSQVDCKMILWFDLENDGDSDLFITNRLGSNHLYENDGEFNFTDITAESNLSQNTDELTFGASLADINNDRFLDLFICNYNWNSEEDFLPNLFYLNNGDGTFTESSEVYNLQGELAQSFQSSWIDYNRDGFLDLYVINDRITYSNRLYENNGGNGFIEKAFDLGLGVWQDCMSNSWGDIDNDGDLDLYISNSFEGNYLFRNDLEFFFDIAEENDMEIESNCWSANWFDFDNNGWLDLHVSISNWNPTLINPNAAFRNLGNGVFESADDLFPNNTGLQHSSAIGDYNNDGYYDMVGHNTYASHTNVWLNSGGENHYLKVTLEGVISNIGGIGSWIDVYTGDMRQSKFTQCGEDYLSQDSQHIIFGLGDYNQVDSIKITWPSGWIDSFYDIPVDQHLDILEGASFQVEIENSSFCENSEHIISAPLGYESYQWSTGDSTNVISPLEEGEYYVIVENDFGLFTTSNSIFYEVLPNPEIISNVNDVSCYGSSDGSIQLNFISDSPHLLTVWNELNDSSLFVDSLSSGVYHYSSSDTNGCFTEGQIEISEPDSLQLTASTFNPSCANVCDGSIAAMCTGGTEPYNFIGIQDSLCEGEYEIMVEDQLGCMSNLSFELIDPAPLLLEILTTDINEEMEGSAEAIVNGGIPPYEFSWNGLVGENFIDGLELDLYELVVSDSLGCQIIGNFEIVLNTHEHLLENLKIMPNPTSDYIYLTGVSHLEIDQVKIYSIEGQLLDVFRSDLTRLNLSHLKPAYYIVSIENRHTTRNYQILKN